MKQIISNTLKDLGVTPGLRGYKYLREAIRRVMEEPDLAEHITKGLYIDIAGDYGTKWTRVERDMRYSIEKAWDMYNPDIRDTIFGNTIDASRGRPTNSEFIATVADYLLLKYANEEE